MKQYTLTVITPDGEHEFEIRPTPNRTDEGATEWVATVDIRNGGRICGYHEFHALKQAPFAIRLFMDGDKWCAVGQHFKNLQQSDAGFGDTPEEAVRAYRATAGPVVEAVGR